MKRWSVVLVLSLLVSLFGFHISHGAEVYKFGTVACITGAIPQHGEYTLRGFRLALEDVEKSGMLKDGKIEVVAEDGQNIPRVALAGLNKLINIDKVQYFETVGSSVVLALAPIAAENKVVLMNTAATHPKIREVGKPYVFSLIPGTASESKAAAQFSFTELKGKTASILYVNNEYGHGARDIFERVFTDLGGKIVGKEIYDLGATDYRTQLAKIRAQNPGVVYFGGHANECGRAIRQAREFGLKTPWIGTVATAAPETLKIAGDSAEGLYAVAFPYDPVGGTPKMRDFGQRFKNAFGVPPTIYSANSYIAATLFAKAIASAVKSGPEISKFLFTIKDWDTIIGKISIDKDGMVDLPCRFLVVKGGNFIQYK
ncbi:MAG: ABC transporter substrate-binding protein [Deltaproteobacteria bacterium]|nr:ABC transporter substrate-binding protein [Deltaproteobacteria bacterium]